MTQTITRLYDSYDTALRAGLALKEAGFTDRAVRAVGRPRQTHPRGSALSEGTGAGAGLGGAIGAAAGLLVGMGVLAIPGVGPAVAAGWPVPVITVGAAGAVAGGATGGLVGVLAGAGTPEPDASARGKGIRRGDSVVTVWAPDDRVAEVTRILSEYSGIGSASRADVVPRSGDARQDISASRSDADESGKGLPAGLP